MYSRTRDIRSSFPRGDKLLLMKMSLEIALSPRLIWVTLSYVGGSRCSKRISQRVFRCLIQRSVSDWIISLSFSPGWLVETIFIERSLKMLSTLISNSYNDVPDEWLWYKPFKLRGWRDWSWHITQPPASLMIIIRGFPFWNKRPKQCSSSFAKIQAGPFVGSYSMFSIILSTFGS